MLSVMLVVGALAHWDAQREADIALNELASAQASLANAVSAELSTRLELARRDAWIVADGASDPTRTFALANQYLATRLLPRGSSDAPSTAPHVTIRVPFDERVVELDIAPRVLLALASREEQPSHRKLFVFPPSSGGVGFDMDGTPVSLPMLTSALAQGGAARLSRPEAASLGLPARMAMAGVATIDAGELGRWAVVVVSSAAAERDRELRASIRLALSVVLAGGVVLAFGSVALRRQRRQLVLERELAIAQLDRDRTERLVRASRAATMGTFAMGIAHEISTPLGVIVGRAEQLLARADDERTRRGLLAIADQSEQIGGLVRAFMALARGGTPTLATVEARDLVDSAVRMIEHRFATKGVSLVINMPSDLPSIHCDIRLIEHALINLLLNACEACDGDGHVELAVRSDGGTMAFVITDDGKGISPENAARATEPFFTTKTDGGADGAGLGLAIVQEIAKSHRGSLSIAPRPGKGTRAAIELPIEHDSERS